MKRSTPFIIGLIAILLVSSILTGFSKGNIELFEAKIRSFCPAKTYDDSVFSLFEYSLCAWGLDPNDPDNYITKITLSKLGLIDYLNALKNYTGMVIQLLPLPSNPNNRRKAINQSNEILANAYNKAFKEHQKGDIDMFWRKFRQNLLETPAPLFRVKKHDYLSDIPKKDHRPEVKNQCMKRLEKMLLSGQEKEKYCSKCTDRDCHMAVAVALSKSSAISNRGLATTAILSHYEKNA